MEYIPLKEHPMIDLGWLDKEIVRVSCVPKTRHFGVLTAASFREAFKKAVLEVQSTKNRKDP